MNWFETLPDQCPPSEALTTAGVTVYRAVLTNPASEEDFKSHRELYPSKFFSVSECQARSISVHDKIEETQKLKKLPRFKNKFHIMELNLDAEDGLILKTNGPHHYSWWRTTEFTFAERQIVA